ncbi:hypothetical protein SAMN06264867_105113 [Halorubrum cibi]|uniref:Uncharacterized protein n=1 Tax=Halorubrum cibi TaxID=413815 RepID=A0A521CWL5_9EURY|nr:hypothetical protein SAMN06264867_105113 [Halorubrum cibi]
MTAVDSHDATADDDEPDSENEIRVIEGHAVQFNEYRY